MKFVHFNTLKQEQLIWIQESRLLFSLKSQKLYRWHYAPPANRD